MTSKEFIMLIGICSDIHGLLSAEAYQALEGVDYVLCAGDIEHSSVLVELETIAPTICVRGNCDGASLSDLPFSKNFTLGGVNFFMTHRPEDVGIVPQNCQVVIHGHTHVPRNEMKNGVLFLNPGSTRKPRGGSNKSIAKMNVENGKVKDVAFVEL